MRWRRAYCSSHHTTPHLAYTMKTTSLSLPLSLLSLLLGGGTAGARVENGDGMKYCTCYTDFYSEGRNYTFRESVSDLGSYGFDNAISSVTGTGFWVFFDQVQYNSEHPGNVHWVHGIDFTENFPLDFNDQSSSVRVVGSSSGLNADYWSIFEGPSFTGQQYFGVDDSPSFDTDGPISSILITGLNPWTFYTEGSYEGESICLYPNSAHHTGGGGQTLDLGIFHHTPEILNKTIKSVRVQCYSENVMHGYEAHVKGMPGHGSSNP